MRLVRVRSAADQVYCDFVYAYVGSVYAVPLITRMSQPYYLAQVSTEYVTIKTVWSCPVADPEGVPWVLWNPSFEGLPSKILCANVLRTLRSHWSYALQLHSSNNARVSPHSCIHR